MANISAIKLPSGNTYNLVDKTSGYITGMTILSYGGSTWQNFIDAYNANKVVYCRASSGSNPASGSQTRLAFMAYVNNATTPTEVEFQYYRSVSTHTASQQGDQVYVYKLNKTNGWSVTTREASVKVVAGTGLGSTYSNGTITLTGPTKISDLTNDSGFITSYTAISPIDITDDDISHEDSGVTAGTYDGGLSKGTGFYVPSITVDAKGHVTSATDLGNLIPLIGSTNAGSEYAHLVGGYQWMRLPQMANLEGNYYSMSAGSTSETFTLKFPYPIMSSYAYNFRVVNVEAYDGSTGEKVIVDWSVSNPYGTRGKTNEITLSVSIAEAYAHTIILHPMLACATARM